MSIKNISILEDKRLFPTVINIIEGSNKVDTAVYTLENYIVNNIDLSTYDWYVDLIGVDGVDEVKLTKTIEDGKLVITFDLTEYVTRLGNTLTYQLVAKDSVGSVWNSAKGIILNSDSIQAEDFIVANYPSILKQWENKIENMAGSLDNAYVMIPYNETVPVESRIAGKFYLQRLNDVDYSCVIEDHEGNILTDGNTVHQSGNETITGLKKFTNNDNANRGVIEISNNNISYTEIPASDEIIGSVRFTDKNSETVGVVETVKTSGNLTSILMNVRNSNNNWGRFLSLSVDEDGESTAYAPTPSVDAMGDEIATASWVNNKTQPATATTYGLMRVAAPVDEVDCTCNDASITPSNLYNILDYRVANTGYEIDEVVGCPYHADLILKCITAGTTSSESLNTRGTLNEGDTLTDGSVVWIVEKIGITTLPIKGDEVIAQSISERHLLFLGGTNLTNGSLLDLRGKNADYPGAFTLRACDADGNYKDLIGNPNGELWWGNKSIAAMGMPSGKYTDLTLGASGTQYSSPANGWVYVVKKSSAEGQYLQVNSGYCAVTSNATGNGQILRVLAPVVKGTNSFHVTYSAGGTTDVFRFIYAEGDNI